jgi:hypothetical protein
MPKLSNYFKLCQTYENLPQLRQSYWINSNYANLSNFAKIMLKVSTFANLCQSYEVLPKLC